MAHRHLHRRRSSLTLAGLVVASACSAGPTDLVMHRGQPLAPAAVAVETGAPAPGPTVTEAPPPPASTAPE
ncbi:MAG TPA: hypothetical protein VNT56_10495, partial [Acidimicrobiales bacterium]|nr:hypothetical protein [Acidimicrobiales bacterium]